MQKCLLIHRGHTKFEIYTFEINMRHEKCKCYGTVRCCISLQVPICGYFVAMFNVVIRMRTRATHCMRQVLFHYFEWSIEQIL